MKTTIKTTTEKDTGITMVWYLNEDKAAVVVDVMKDYSTGWVAKFRGRKVTGFYTKAQAVSHAKTMLKKAMVN